MSARENIAKNIENQLKNMTNPAPGVVSRVFFDIQKLAITQFPAILIVTASETQGLIQYQLRCYVRGTEVDTLRNNIVEEIEETLEVSRDRDITLSGTNIHNVTTHVASIEVIERELPLGEVVVNVNVQYTYKRGVL